ncbi:MAG: CehA/McbA family metallohydrolase [Planctomycetia bacterium]|nr:CehA/McbA family metallohydrolase [Planctomycetia bacterium]
MKKRALALIGTCVTLILALVWSRSENVAVQPVAVKLPKALGAIHPRLSPDGNTLAFSYQGEIWTAPRTGGTMTSLTPSEGADAEPTWAPDGKRIAFLRGGTVKVVQFPDGKEVALPKAIQTGGPYAVNKLEFSADGKKLLGAFRFGGKGNSLAWVDLETGDVQELTPLPPVSYNFRFALSQDSKWIVYTAMPDQPLQQSGSEGSHTDLMKRAADGKDKPEKLCRLPGRVHDLCWTDDGRSLVLSAELGGAHDDLWKLPLDGDSLRGLVKLTSGQADEDRPSVSRDGRWLVYTDNRAGSTALIAREMTSGEENAIRFDKMDYRRPTGTLRLKVTDADGKPVVARISLKQDKGRFHAPPGALHRSLRGRGHFYCDQGAEFTLPAGTYTLAGFRGPEYKVASQQITIEAGQVREVTVEMNRWVHLAKDSWYSGELHIHANYGYGQWFNTPETMRQQCVGEDLNVCNFMVANSDADVVYDRPFFRGGPDPLSTPEYILYWNQEFRSTIWGHMTLVNLTQVVEPVFTGFKDTTNPWDTPSNADIADRTHWQKGVVNYTHVSQAADWSKTPYAAKSIPVDVALGKIDTLDINNSWAGSVPLWYRLLNCGFRLPATAGTDVFLNRIGSNLPGGDRVYVHTGKQLSYSDWIDGLKAGKSFVTNGPMLTFTVNGSEPGSVLKLGEKPKVKVKATAKSQFPLTKAELVHNGKVIASATLAADKLSATLDQEVALDRGGWLAFRADGPGTPDTALSTQNAHTNPIYIEAAGMGYRSPDEARAFIKWIEQFELVLRTRDRFPTPKHREQALEQLDAARTVYLKIIQDAK